MFPEALVNGPLFGIGLTVIAYVVAEIIVSRLELSLPPFVIAATTIIAFLLYTPSVTYEQYAVGADFINFLLGPATIAFALPLYRNREIIREKSTIIFLGIMVATCTAIVSVYICGKLIGASDVILLSLVPKSITTPIAIEVTKTIGGLPALTAPVVVFTGVLGATFNHKLLKLLGVKHDIAIGLAVGASSHGLGTSACIKHSLVQVALGGVAIALTGIATSILAPILLPLLQYII